MATDFEPTTAGTTPERSREQSLCLKMLLHVRAIETAMITSSDRL
jgi:hypothetical protein